MEVLKKQIGELLLKHNLPAMINEVREVVCAVAADEVDDSTKLVVSKTFSSSYSESVKAFNEEVKPLIEGNENVDIEVTASISAGDMYLEIKDVVKMGDKNPTNMTHT